jgi:hypothetical protein
MRVLLDPKFLTNRQERQERNIISKHRTSDSEDPRRWFLRSSAQRRDPILFGDLGAPTAVPLVAAVQGFSGSVTMTVYSHHDR